MEGKSVENEVRESLAGRQPTSDDITTSAAVAPCRFSRHHYVTSYPFLQMLIMSPLSQEKNNLQRPISDVVDSDLTFLGPLSALSN